MSNPKTDPGKKQQTNPGAEKPIVAIGDGFTWDPPEDLVDKNGHRIDQKNLEPTQVVRERKTARDLPAAAPEHVLAAARMGVMPGEEPVPEPPEDAPDEEDSPPPLADDTDQELKPRNPEVAQQSTKQKLVDEVVERLFEEGVHDNDLSAILQEKTEVTGAPEMSAPEQMPFVMPTYDDEPEGFVEHLVWLLKMPLRAFHFLRNIGNAGMDAAAALEMSQNNRTSLGSLRFAVETEKQANLDGFAAMRGEILTSGQIAERRVLNIVNAYLESPETKPAKFKDVWILGEKLISRDENLAQMITALQKQHDDHETTLEKLKKTYFANPDNVKNMMSQLVRRDQIRYETAQKMEAFEQRFGALLTQEGLSEAFIVSALPQIKQLIEIEGKEAWSKLADKFFGEMDKFASEWKIDMANKLEEAKIATARAKEDLMAVMEGSEIFVPLAKNAVQEAHDLTMQLTRKIEEARALKLTDAELRSLVRNMAVEMVDDYLVAKIMKNEMPTVVSSSELPTESQQQNAPKAPDQWTNPAVIHTWTMAPVPDLMREDPITDPLLKQPEVEAQNDDGDVFASIPQRVGMSQVRKSAIILDMDDDEKKDEGPTDVMPHADFVVDAETVVPESRPTDQRVTDEVPVMRIKAVRSLEQLMAEHVNTSAEAQLMQAMPPPPPPLDQEKLVEQNPKPVISLADLENAVNPPVFSKRTRNVFIATSVIGGMLALLGIGVERWTVELQDSHELQDVQTEQPNIVQAEPPQVSQPEAQPEPEMSKPEPEAPQEAAAEESPSKAAVKQADESPQPRREERARQPQRSKKVEEVDEFGFPKAPAVEEKKHVPSTPPRGKKKTADVDEMGFPIGASAAAAKPQAAGERVRKKSYAETLSEILGATVTVKKKPVEYDEDGLPKNRQRPVIKDKGTIQMTPIPTPKLDIREGGGQ